MPTAMDSLTQLAWLVISHYEIFVPIFLLVFISVTIQTLKERFIEQLYMRKIRSLQSQNELLKSQAMSVESLAWSSVQTTKATTTDLVETMTYAIVWLNDKLESVTGKLESVTELTLSLQDRIEKLERESAKRIEIQQLLTESIPDEDTVKQKDLIVELIMKSDLTQEQVAETLSFSLSKLEKLVSELKDEGRLPERLPRKRRKKHNR